MLRERQDKIARQLANGACLGDDASHGIAVGRYREIEDLLGMDFDDMKGE